MKTGKHNRILAGILTDVLLASVILLVFAYFHHGRYLLRGESFADVPEATAAPSATPAPSPETSPEAAPEDSPEPAGPFTAGEVEQTETSYRSANVSVEWTRHEEVTESGTVVYYIADIYLRSPEYLRTAYTNQGYRSVHEMAAEANAIVAIDGDYAFSREYGPILRNGQLIRDTGYSDTLVYYADGSMKVFGSGELDMEAEMEKGVLQVWSFGPRLLDAEGKSLERFNTNIAGLNPRAALGYYEPGHYCFVVADGRGENDSPGFKLRELSALFERLGCTLAYNFDGGKSAVMVWDGGTKTVNTPAGGGRNVTDIIYIAKE